MSADKIIAMITENLGKLFFPEEWIALDMKFSKSELFTMLILRQKDELTMSALSEHIHIPMSTATGMVDRLVKNHYVKRERRDDDRRIVVLRLTEKGNGAVEAFQAVLLKYLDRLTAELSEEEQQLLIGIVFKALRAFSAPENDDAAEREGETLIPITID